MGLGGFRVVGLKMAQIGPLEHDDINLSFALGQVQTYPNTQLCVTYYSCSPRSYSFSFQESTQSISSLAGTMEPRHQVDHLLSGWLGMSSGSKWVKVGHGVNICWLIPVGLVFLNGSKT